MHLPKLAASATTLLLLGGFAARKFVGTNWQWIIATLTALTGAVWKYLSARKNKAATA
jgi:hypothetical protein